MEYGITDYADMVADDVRMDAYVAALRSAVRPGSTVLDIGTGTGVVALLACSLGARHVYGIEPSPLIELARAAAVDNGVADRLTLIQGVSTRVELPERVDVIVSDLRGVLPLYTQHLVSIADARARFLAPGGALIPARDTIVAALLESPGDHAYLDVWRSRSRGLRLDAAASLAAGTFWKTKAEASQLLTGPVALTTIDYARVEAPNVAGEASLHVTRDGVAHGLCLWFDAELADGVGFSNRPGEPRLIYNQAFFPLSRPVEVARGDTAELSFRASLVDGDYLFAWDTSIRRDGATVARFRQSTLDGLPLTPALLGPSSEHHVPSLDEDGVLVRAVLERIDGVRSLGAIADELLAERPASFGSRADALARVARVVRKHAGRA